MQVGEAVAVRFINNNGVGVGDVQTRFHDGGAEQHVIVAVDEAEHNVLKFSAFHLAVGHGDAHARHVFQDEVVYIHNVLDAVVDEEHLTVAGKFKLYGIADEFPVEAAKLGLHGIAVGRRRGDDAQIPRTHHRELQGSWDGRGGQSQRIDVGFHLFQFLLHGHAEFLFLIDDEQAQILEFHIFSSESVRPNDDVDFAFFEFFQDFGLLFGRLETVEVFDGDGEAVETLCEGVVVLQSQHGGRHQNGHLFRVAAGLEGGAHGHFGLAEAHVAAHEAVHGVLAFHVAFHVVGGFQLVGGVLVDERSLQLVLQVVVGRKLESGRALALGVELDEFTRNVFDLAFRLVFQAVPRAAAEGAQMRFGAVFAAVFRNAVQRVDAHIK